MRQPYCDRISMIRWLENQIDQHAIALAALQQALYDLQTNREKYYSMLVENMELTVRTSNCLKADGIIFVGDVASRPRTYFLRSSGLGKKSVTEIENMLHNLGLTFECMDPLWVRPEHESKPVER